MASTVKHISFTVSIVSVFAACKKHDPCEENPNAIYCDAGADEVGDGDGDPAENGDLGNADDAGPKHPFNECSPLEPDQTGRVHQCQGIGNGWLDLTVYPVGKQPPECVNWGDKGEPENPTTADCVPLDLGALPNGVPSPSACCLEGTDSPLVTDQCIKDCGFAACKLAIAKMREAAHSLPEKGPKGVVRDDLFHLAKLLDTPLATTNCAQKVTKANGQVAIIQLGAGSSGAAIIGHVQAANLHLQCSLDELEPFLASNDPCQTPPNIPIAGEKSRSRGVAELGMVDIEGPNGRTNTTLLGISYEFSETHNLDGSIDFLLTDFNAIATTTEYGDFTYVDPSLRLRAPASGRLVGEQVSFPAGSLRIEVSAAIVSGRQELLFDGERITGVFANTEDAIATRTADDTFAIVEATFAADDHLFVLATRWGTVRPQ
jgi:hypothetical protein